MISHTAHVRHYLLHPLKEMFNKFLESDEYREWCVAEVYTGSSPALGATSFMEIFQCYCHTPMKVEQCVCPVCYQMMLYVEALRQRLRIPRLEEGTCLCKCKLCKEKRCIHVKDVFDSQSTFSRAVLCEYIDYFDCDDTFLPSQKCLMPPPKCIQGTCSDCGAKKKLDECVHLDTNEDTICVDKLQDVKQGENMFENQIVRSDMPVKDIWKELNEYHTKTYIQHHCVDKYLKATKHAYMDFMRAGDVYTSCDFAEKFKLEGHGNVVRIRMQV